MHLRQTAGIASAARLTHTGVRAQRDIPRWWYALKRCVDVVLTLVLCMLAAPIVLLAAIAVAAVSPGSPFFAQERVGQHGRRFLLFKIRTMVCGAHLDHERLRHLSDVSGPVFKMRNDPRLHALGALLRRTSIDELPNLLNVLRGEMSLVGPRPPLPKEVEHYDARAFRRLSVKPGITCLWQVSGRSNVDFERWMDLDNEYVDTWTPWGDLVLIARTVPAVLRGEGAH